MSVEVHDRPDAGHYEVLVDGVHAGLAAYQRDGDRVVFLHTEVDDDYEGQGVGGALVRGALDDVRARGLRAVPVCSFVRGWLGKHPDYADLVA